MIARALVTAILAATATVATQQPGDPDAAPRDAWEVLLRRWADKQGPVDVAARAEQLRAFVEQYPTGRWTALAWCHLGGLLLRELDGPGAEDAFAHAMRLTADKDLDSRGRALYGLAQAQELQGRVADARASLERIGPSFDGTRYRRFARVALRRLAEGSPRPDPGDPMPRLQLGADVRTSVGPPPRDEPYLLVFFHLDHATTREAVERLAAVWEPSERPMIAIDLSGRRDRCAEYAAERKWACHVICAEAGFLHEDALQLAVSAVPSWFVVDRKGRLLARDLSAERLGRLLR